LIEFVCLSVGLSSMLTCRGHKGNELEKDPNENLIEWYFT